MISFIKKFIQVFKENYQIELAKLQHQTENKVNSNESTVFTSKVTDEELERRLKIRRQNNKSISSSKSKSRSDSSFIYKHHYSDSSSSSSSSCSGSSSSGSCD